METRTQTQVECGRLLCAPFIRWAFLFHVFSFFARLAVTSRWSIYLRCTSLVGGRVHELSYRPEYRKILTTAGCAGSGLRFFVCNYSLACLLGYCCPPSTPPPPQWTAQPNPTQPKLLVEQAPRAHGRMYDSFRVSSRPRLSQSLCARRDGRPTMRSPNRDRTPLIVNAIS